MGEKEGTQWKNDSEREKKCFDPTTRAPNCKLYSSSVAIEQNTTISNM